MYLLCFFISFTLLTFPCLSSSTAHSPSRMELIMLIMSRANIWWLCQFFLLQFLDIRPNFQNVLVKFSFCSFKIFLNSNFRMFRSTFLFSILRYYSQISECSCQLFFLQRFSASLQVNVRSQSRMSEWWVSILCLNDRMIFFVFLLKFSIFKTFFLWFRIVFLK